ncbi:hypothetical protein [Geomonas azotofigens]|uniref:hypothetical protein n=1 Tax=Geomonas azotofigens TaxID=2843196 RepID=UPI001C120D10|nr:hypothetical protein [Geomonas azotofigens]MBU5615337.1 hypothetical protein [Geomonas azotofigens]
MRKHRPSCLSLFPGPLLSIVSTGSTASTPKASPSAITAASLWLTKTNNKPVDAVKGICYNHPPLTNERFCLAAANKKALTAETAFAIKLSFAVTTIFATE